MSKCPRCGEPMNGGICDNCGFPLLRCRKMMAPAGRRWLENRL